MSELSTVIDAAGERFEEISPHGLNYSAEKGFAIQILNNNSYLMSVAKASPHSLQQAITNIAAVGLSLNPAKAQAYLIARNVKVGKNKYESRIFLDPSYRGLCDIITSSGTIEWIQAECVYSNDPEFTHNGPGIKPTHKFDPFLSIKERGEFRGVYSVAKTSNGDYLTEMMSSEDIYSIRSRSESFKVNSGPWKTDFVQMAKKSCVRRQYKMLPKTKELNVAHEAVNISNENEGFEPIITNPDISSYTAEQKEYFNQLITKSDAIGMFVFRESLSDDTVFTNLYHSFERGQKGKFQAMVDRLVNDGQSSIDDYADLLNDACEREDQAAIIEECETLSNEALECIKSRMELKYLMFFNSAINRGEES